MANITISEEMLHEVFCTYLHDLKDKTKIDIHPYTEAEKLVEDVRIGASSEVQDDIVLNKESGCPICGDPEGDFYDCPNGCSNHLGV